MEPGLSSPAAFRPSPGRPSSRLTSQGMGCDDGYVKAALRNLGKVELSFRKARQCRSAPASWRPVSRGSCEPRQSDPLHRLTPQSLRLDVQDFSRHSSPDPPRNRNARIETSGQVVKKACRHVRNLQLARMMGQSGWQTISKTYMREGERAAARFSSCQRLAIAASPGLSYCGFPILPCMLQSLAQAMMLHSFTK